MRPFFLKTVALLTLASFGSSFTCAWAARFVDLGGNWSEKYINRLSDQGVINAEPDGKFLPNQPVTRAVFAYWLVKVLGLDNQPVAAKPSFADVKPTDWCYKPVEIMRQNNFISGYADGFRPNELIQRAEVISIIAKTLNAPAPSESAIEQALSNYTDRSKIPPWAKTGVAQATLAGVLISQTPHQLNPMSMATRGDTAAMLCKLNQFVTHQTISDSTDQASQAMTQVPVPGQNQSGYQQPAMASAPQAVPQLQPYGAPGYSQPYGDPNAQYQGRVQEQIQNQNAQAYAPPPQAYAPPPQFYQQPQYGQQGGYPMQNGAAQGSYPPQGNYAAPPQQGYPPLQGQSGSMGGYPPPQSARGPMLQGNVAMVAAGTHFQANLKNTLDSGSTRPGEPVEATLGAPIYQGGVELVPAGSKVTGQVTNVVSAKRFKFGANGKIEIKFTQVETPDGRKFPLNASIDSTNLKLSGGTTKGRVGKSLLATGIGAGGGALVGTAFGAMMGGAYHAPLGPSAMRGAAYGTVLGGGAGLVTAGVRKGSEVKISAGTPLPIKLDQPMQVTAAVPMQQQQQQPYGYGGGGMYPPGYPGGGYPQQQQQPPQGFYPQQ